MLFDVSLTSFSSLFPLNVLPTLQRKLCVMLSKINLDEDERQGDQKIIVLSYQIDLFSSLKLLKHIFD